MIVIVGSLLLLAVLNKPAPSDQRFEGPNITARSPRAAVGHCGFDPSGGQRLGRITDVQDDQRGAAGLRRSVTEDAVVRCSYSLCWMQTGSTAASSSTSVLRS